MGQNTIVLFGSPNCAAPADHASEKNGMEIVPCAPINHDNQSVDLISDEGSTTKKTQALNSMVVTTGDTFNIFNSRCFNVVAGVNSAVRIDVEPDFELMCGETISRIP